jgi:hypothetical protein
MLQEAINKLVRAYRSCLYSVSIAAVAVRKADLAVVVG